VVELKAAAQTADSAILARRDDSVNAPAQPVRRCLVQRRIGVRVEVKRVAAISSSSCATDVALAMGAVTPGAA
jgi:hypothetical protein